MTHIRTATVELTVGSETLNTTVNQIIRLMLRAGFVPLTLTQTSQTTNLKVSTWQIRFVHMGSLTLLNEYLMSFITTRLLAASLIGNGVNTVAQTHTPAISISHSIKAKLTIMKLFLKYLC